MARVVIGLVGYYQFVRGYPIGPDLKEGLDAVTWPDEHEVTLKEMNWGPIAIVQDFQASDETLDRIVLVSAVDRGLESGTVSCRRWIGGEQNVLAVQNRVFEAVTGVISLDNLLVIGEHFGIWPEELITIELQLDNTAFGDLVMAEMEVNRDVGEINIVGENPLAPEMEKNVQRVFESTRQAALHGAAGLNDVVTLSSDQLTPLADICHNQFMEDCRLPTKPN
ncbi:MAG: hypothetical protein DSY87_07810 [Methylococcus sp.]|nr:MAG: hypothetical protein DSY87_07810 [Methylococcus sp.]